MLLLLRFILLLNVSAGIPCHQRDLPKPHAVKLLSNHVTLLRSLKISLIHNLTRLCIFDVSLSLLAGKPWRQVLLRLVSDRSTRTVLVQSRCPMNTRRTDVTKQRCAAVFLKVKYFYLAFYE